MSLKIDFHVHSKASKDGSMSLEEIAINAKANGLDAVFVCDHNKYSFEEKKKINDVWLISGCEISTKGAHILALFCDPKVDIDRLNENGLVSTDDAIKEIKRCNGISIIAHPFDHQWDENLSNLPDGVEVNNARAWMRVKDANEKALDYANRKGLFMLSSSDAHMKEEIGNAYTIVSCDDVDEIKTALVCKKTEPVLVENTKRIYKGKSQLIKYKAEKKYIKGHVYYIYSLLRSIFGR